MPSGISGQKYDYEYMPGIVRVNAQTGEVDETTGGDQTHFAIAKRLALEKESGK